MLSRCWPLNGKSLDAQQYPRTPFHLAVVGPAFGGKHFAAETGSLKRHEFFLRIAGPRRRWVAWWPFAPADIKTYVMGGSRLAGASRHTVLWFRRHLRLSWHYLSPLNKKPKSFRAIVFLFFLHCESEWDLFLWNGNSPLVRFFTIAPCFKMDRQIPDYLVPLPENVGRKFSIRPIAQHERKGAQDLQGIAGRACLRVFAFIELLEEIPLAP